jgi:hypothetical protein
LVLVKPLAGFGQIMTDRIGVRTLGGIEAHGFT